MCGNEIKPRTLASLGVLSYAMYPAICSYDEQALNNMSKESEKKNFIVKISLRPVQSQGKVEQAKNMVTSDPSKVTQDTPEDTRER